MQLHNNALCVNDFGKTNVNGTEIPLLQDDNGGYSGWLLKGWLKVAVTMKILLLNHDVMFMDIDMVAIKSPLQVLDTSVDVAATVDCHDYYEPRTAR